MTPVTRRRDPEEQSLATHGTALFTGRAARLAASILFTAILARELGPAPLGSFQMALTVFAMLGALTDFGLPHAVVHHGLPSGPNGDWLFRRNAVNAGRLLLALVASSPLLALFFGRAEVGLVMVAVSVAVCTAILFNLHTGLLRHELRFGELAVIETASVVAGGLTGVLAALLGAGVWALVIQYAVQRLGLGAGAWLATGWRPRLAPRTPPDADLHRYTHYASGAMWGRLLGNVSRNVDRLVLGRVGGEAALALFRTNLRYSELPSETAAQPLGQLCIGGLSRSTRRGASDRGTFRTLFEILLWLTVPASVLVALEAELVADLLLGPKWTGSAPVLRVLALGSLALPLRQATKWVWLGEGRTGSFLRYSALAAPVTVGAILGGAWVGSAWPERARSLAASLTRGGERGLPVLGPLPSPADLRVPFEDSVAFDVAVPFAVAVCVAVAAWLQAPLAVAMACRGGGIVLRDFVGAGLPPVLMTGAAVLAWFLVQGDGPDPSTPAFVSAAARATAFAGTVGVGGFALRGLPLRRALALRPGGES